MEEEACLVVYYPSIGSDHPCPPLPPSLAGTNTHTQPINERAAAVTFHPLSDPDFPARVKSSLALAASPAADAYVSQPLSRSSAVCLVRVDGMVCTSCVQLIETSISKEEGVHGVRVSLAGQEAVVEFDPALISAQDIASAIDDMGFEAECRSTHTVKDVLPHSLFIHHEDTHNISRDTEEKSVDIAVEGMVCQSCVSNIQSNVSTVSGVRGISVSLADKTASITYDSALVTVKELCTAIEDLGFEASCGIAKTAIVKSCKTNEPAGEVGDVRRCSGEVGDVRRCSGEVGDVKKCSVKIEGMTCHSCVSLIESVVRDLGGVVNVSVTLATKEGVVEYNARRVGEDEIRSAIEDTGFEVISISG